MRAMSEENRRNSDTSVYGEVARSGCGTENAGAALLKCVEDALATEKELERVAVEICGFAQRLLSKASETKKLDILIVLGEILGGWLLDSAELALIQSNSLGLKFELAFAELCEDNNTSVSQVYGEWLDRLQRERSSRYMGDRPSYVFVGQGGGAFEFPGEFLRALAGGSPEGNLMDKAIVGVAVSGGSMGGIYA